MTNWRMVWSLPNWQQESGEGTVHIEPGDLDCKQANSGYSSISRALALILPEKHCCQDIVILTRITVLIHRSANDRTSAATVQNLNAMPTSEALERVLALYFQQDAGVRERTERQVTTWVKVCF